MRTSAASQLIDLQRSMYDRALNEARECSGIDAESIASYQTKFEESLPNEFESVPARKLMEAIDRNSIILFGDFHSHKQCQRAFLRILRMYHNRPDHAPIAVALEMFRSKDQGHLDSWLLDGCSDEELLLAIDYDKNWGFPWANFKPILEFCKQQKIPVIGINTASSGRDKLRKRDLHAARLIHKLLDKKKNAKIMCMIGEFHLANDHLPQALIEKNATSKNGHPLRIFANLDKYFFSIKPERIQRTDDYLKLNDTTYCVINSAPWIKWQSQLLWEESRQLGVADSLADDAESDWDLDIEGDDHYEEYVSEAFDISDHLRHLVGKLSEFLSLKTTQSGVDKFHILSGVLTDELDHLEQDSCQGILLRASTDGFAVDLPTMTVYMPEVSANHLAAAAGQMLFGGCLNDVKSINSEEYKFLTNCLKFTFGFISNKILNPRVPLHSRRHLETYIMSTRRKRLNKSQKSRLNLARNALKAWSWIEKSWAAAPKSNLKFRTIPRSLVTLDSKTSQEFSKTLAQLIAEPVCRGLAKGRIDSTDVKAWISSDFHSTDSLKRVLANMLTLS